MLLLFLPLDVIVLSSRIYYSSFLWMLLLFLPVGIVVVDRLGCALSVVAVLHEARGV
eukprot:m.789645 g.789645  ORF g.789645 m.789645 type:complete len:57 (-) comp59197_c0_seq5:315-485(-)